MRAHGKGVHSVLRVVSNDRTKVVGRPEVHLEVLDKRLILLAVTLTFGTLEHGAKNIDIALDIDDSIRRFRWILKTSENRLEKNNR